MNPKDHNWLNKQKENHPEWFKGTRVLELGSRTINGTVREHFDNSDFVGVDWIAGQDVDVVCFAHETKFKKKFDVLISFSMLEHDQYWEKSLTHNLQWLKNGGIVLLSWAGKKSQPHGIDYGTDIENYEVFSNEDQRYKELMKEYRKEGKHYFPKSLEEVKGLLEKNGLEILETQTEIHGVGEVHLLSAKK